MDSPGFSGRGDVACTRRLTVGGSALRRQFIGHLVTVSTQAPVLTFERWDNEEPTSDYRYAALHSGFLSWAKVGSVSHACAGGTANLSTVSGLLPLSTRLCRVPPPKNGSPQSHPSKGDVDDENDAKCARMVVCAEAAAERVAIWTSDVISDSLAQRERPLQFALGVGMTGK